MRCLRVFGIALETIVNVARAAEKIGKALLLLGCSILLSSCTAIFIAGGVIGAGVAVAGTAVDVGVGVGSAVVGGTAKVVKAAVPGD